MDLLKRELAPILPEAWKFIDDEARRVLRLNLAGRKVVDFAGPHGWTFAAVNTGRLRNLEVEPAPGVAAGLRSVQPMLELRTPIRLPILELDVVARGAEDPDLSEVVKAAEAMARAEDGAIFNGYQPAGIAGIVPSSPHAPLRIAEPTDWPAVIVRAKEVLRSAGVGGPYALVLGPSAYDELSAGSEDGYPLSKRIERHLIEGPLVWAPAVSGAILISMRGGDYELTVGQDLSIGYAYHEKQTVELYLASSFTFRVLEPAAAIHLRRG